MLTRSLTALCIKVITPLASAAVLLWQPAAIANADKGRVIHSIDARADQNAAIARSIWKYAETSFDEHQSSTLLQEALAEEGFDVISPVAGMPTAFIASYGQGEPVIVLLAEFDALPCPA